MSFCVVSSFESPKLIMRHCTMTMQTEENYPVHTHKGYELLLFKKGDASYSVLGEDYPLRKNSLIITRPGQSHRLCIHSDDTYDRYNLIFPAETFSSKLLAKIPEDLHILQFDGNNLVTGLFEKMDYYCHTLPAEYLPRAILALTEELLWNIILQCDRQKDHSNYRHPLTHNALEFMEQRLFEIDTITQVCEALSISKSYLYQIFQEDLSTTPKAYLNRRRLELARQEILLGAKASSLYALCGFADYSTFYRAYKKHFGYAPSDTQEATFQPTVEK